jgi:energy-converting hydrogenase Eha subunit C
MGTVRPDHRTGSSVREVVTSQPLDRFWSFQWLESGLFIAAAAALIWLAFYWVRNRLG